MAELAAKAWGSALDSTRSLCNDCRASWLQLTTQDERHSIVEHVLSECWHGLDKQVDDPGARNETVPLLLRLTPKAATSMAGDSPHSSNRRLAVTWLPLLAFAVVLLLSLPSPSTATEMAATQATAKHALVVGASSGIGRATAHEVAPLVDKLTLASRSCPPDLIPSIKQRNPNVDVTHEKLDASSLRDVRRFTEKHKETQFDWIVMSPGLMNMNGRTETPEGLDVKMATHYYGRFLLINDLLPNLNRPGVRVLNVLGAVHGGQPDVNDLDLKTTFSLKRCAEFTCAYSDFAVQSFSERAPQASFIHAAPGGVATAIADNLPWYARMPLKALMPLVTRSPEKCGKAMTSALTKPEYASGWHLIGKDAESLKPAAYHTDEMKDIVWKHTVSTIDSVLQQCATNTAEE